MRGNSSKGGTGPPIGPTCSPAPRDCEALRGGDPLDARSDDIGPTRVTSWISLPVLWTALNRQ
jgi:hypothetical protein